MGSSVEPPFFFISYAHDADDNEHVHRFYRDLDHDVRLFAGRNEADAAGFCDVDIRLGDRWSAALIDNLSTAQVFIPVMTPRYFRSEACGKEWQIFLSRLDLSRRLEQQESSIIPLLWVPMELPEIAQPYQFREESFGAEYDRVKLRALVRESRRHDDYVAFVELLARRVVEVTSRAPVSELPRRPGFHDVESAFAAEVPAPRHAPRANPAAVRPRKQVRDRPILNTNLPEDPR